MPTQTADSRLTLIPVDPHRVFAAWYVAPAVLDEALRGGGGGDAKLTLRISRMDRGAGGESQEGVVVGDFDAGRGWNERFLSLGEPGGTVTGSLGVRDGSGGFTACLSSLPVTLPEAPARPAAPPAAEPEPEPAVSAPAAQPSEEDLESGLLDERGVIEAAGIIDGLPPELVRIAPPTVEDGVLAALPPSRTYPADYYPARAGAPAAAVRAGAGDGEGGGPRPVSASGAVPGAASAQEQAPSSHRLASQVVPGSDPAPLRVRATLVVAGRVAPGMRLRIGSREIEIRPDGGFDLRWELDSFPAVWAILLDLFRRPEGAGSDAPSVELLASLPDTGALLSLDSSIDIEGEAGDPAYAAHLPPGLAADASGRFRVCRPLPAGILLLPHLVLLAG